LKTEAQAADMAPPTPRVGLAMRRIRRLLSPQAWAGRWGPPRAGRRSRSSLQRRFLRTILALAAVTGFLLLSSASRAGPMDDYIALFDQRAAEAEGYEIWGNTFLPPAGMWGVQFKWNTVRSDSRYDENGEKGPILKPIDIFGGVLDLNPRGKAQGYSFTLLCGLGKGWAVALEVPTGYYDLEFDVLYDPPTSATAQAAAAVISALFGTDPFTESLEGLWQTIELLGHPRPVLVSNDLSLKLGDISLAVGCNYYRSRHFSFLGAMKFSFPTGHLADPNASLIFALGPDVDVGVGSFGFELGHMIDIRLPKPLDWIILATEVFYSFYTEHQRESPTVFTPPNQEVITLLSITGTDVGPYFPDLSNMEPEYGYIPGSKVRGSFQILPTLFGLIPLNLGIQANYTNASQILTSTPEFKQYVDAVGLVADGWSVEAFAKVTLGLFPLKIPATVSVGYNKSIAGKNALILDQNIDVVFQFYSPWFLGEQIFPGKKIFGKDDDA